MKEKVVVLGAGLTGLTAGWKLAEAGAEVEVVEQQCRVGGLASSFEWNGYTLDLGPHKIYPQFPEVLREVFSLFSGEEILEHKKTCTIRLGGKYLSYPIKITEVLLKSPVMGLWFGLSYASTKLRKKSEEETYEDYSINRFGKKIYDTVFEPYAEKVWGDPKKLSADLARTRVALPSLSEMLKRMILGNRGKRELSATKFYYPRRGMVELPKKMVQKIEEKRGCVRLNAEVKALKLSGKRVKAVEILENGRRKELAADQVVSTISVNMLPAIIKPEPPQKIIEAARALKFNDLVLFYIVVNKEQVLREHWTFFPEKEFIFNRVSEQKNFSLETAPGDKTVLCAEVTCSKESEAWKKSDLEIFEIVAAHLEKAGLVKQEEIAGYKSVRLDSIYPVYDLNYKRNLDEIEGYLQGIENLHTIGRAGLFNYNNMDHCMKMGFELAKHISQRKPKSEWLPVRESFNHYKIID